MTDPYRRFSVRLHEHTGIVFFWVQRSITCTGTLEQCEKAYRDAQRHCLVTGWWGLVSFFLMNPIALISNYTAIRRVRAQAKEAPAPHLATPYAPAGQAAPAVAPRQAVAPHPAAPPRPVGPPPGWYPDPGGPGQRYWDGVAWTHWTHPR
ncbi:DUF2510 domain-containing protein [Mycobacterium sp. 050272]|uniref:DUF2510 domain-containing protein n=1 Tax=Mycobacterium sp. 050272 TaxID=3142488 RepID=UPI00319ADDA9